MTNQLLVQPTQEYSVGFMNTGAFELSQRVAKMFALSNLVPKDYQNNLPNCVIALNMASRIGADPLMVMQNLVIVHGKPTWSSQFLIATFNTCGKYSRLSYEFFGEKGTDEWGCRAVATDLSTGEKIIGTDVTIGIAKSEGWYNRNGSKWKTMPQQMLTYRAAAWFVRTNAPEISMGLHTQDEIIDIEPSEVDVTPVAENVTEKEKPVTKAKTKTKDKSVETLLGGSPNDEIKESVDVANEPATETVIKVEVAEPPPAPVIAEAEYSDMPTDLPPIEGTVSISELQPQSAGTMQITGLEPEQPRNGLLISPEHKRWMDEIDAWQTLTDIANTTRDMPAKIKADLKEYMAEKNAQVKHKIDISNWVKEISNCNSRADFTKLQSRMPESIRNDEVIQYNLRVREDYGINNHPDLW